MTAATRIRRHALTGATLAVEAALAVAVWYFARQAGTADQQGWHELADALDGISLAIVVVLFGAWGLEAVRRHRLALDLADAHAALDEATRAAAAATLRAARERNARQHCDRRLAAYLEPADPDQTRLARPDDTIVRPDRGGRR